METKTIRELCDIVVDCPHSTPKWTTSGKIVIRNNNIKKGRIDFSSPSYTDDEHFNLRVKRAIPRSGDIIITREAPMGEVGMIPERIECCLGQRMVLLRTNPDICDNYYLLYSLQSKFVQHQISWSEGTGTTVSNLRIPHLEQLKIPYVPLKKQRLVASVLKSIEEKIILNEQINNNLEQQAMALFKSWFIDYEPFGGQLPTIWKSGVLGDFVEIKRGGSPRPIQNFLSDSGLHWLKISDATCISSPFINEIKEYIIEDGLKKTVFLKAGNLVLSNSATPGLTKILDIDTCIHDGWLYFPSSKFSNEYLYLYFRHIRDNLVALGNGSVFTNLKTDILKNYPTNLPTGDVLSKFDEVIKPMFSMILSKTRESKRLMEIRDSLLPKLMSGELDVSDINL